MGEPIQLTQEQFGDLIRTVVKETFDQSGLTKIDRKHNILPGDSEKDVQEMTKEQRIMRFIKAVLFRNHERAVELSGIPDALKQKALVEGTDASGGYLVPAEFLAEVLRIAPTYGVARRNCRIVPMTRDKLNVPKAGSTGVAAYWVDEAGQITESSPTFGQVPLDSKKCAGIAALSTEMFDDAAVDILSYLYEIFAEAIAGAEDTQWLTGTGSPITGLLGSSSVNVVTMSAGRTSFADITADDLLDLPDAVDENAETNAKYYFHKNIVKYLRKLKDDNGQYIWDRPASSQPGTIWGYPYEVTSKMPGTSSDAPATKFVAFGDGRYTLFGDRKQLAIAIATEGTVGSNKLFEQDMKALRIIERVDIQIAIATAYAVLKTAAA